MTTSSASYISASAYCIYRMQMDRYEIFKAQDQDKGEFDVEFVIEGKTLYANKVFLTTISEPFAAMLSSRWSQKNEPIKIECSSYDNFYQFLCFIYSGHCELTSDNIYQMVDIAEYYGVTCFKDFCDKYLATKQDITPGSIEEMYELADKYKLPCFLKAIKDHIGLKGDTVIRSQEFISFKKPFFKFISMALNGNFKEESFEGAYKWIEHQVKQNESAMNDENFNLQETVKAHLSNMIPFPVFYKMKHEFLMNFVVENGFYLSPSELHKIFLNSRNNYCNDSITFKSVYELAEKQAMIKQKMAPADASFNFVEYMEEHLAPILPFLKFQFFNKQFLLDFVAAKGFLLSSEALCQIYQYFGFGVGDEQKGFKFVCELAEKQILQRKNMLHSDENFNVADAIKTDLSQVIPLAFTRLHKVDKEFLYDFVVANGLITEEEASHVYNTRVEVKNGDHSISGIFVDIYGIRRAFEKYVSDCTKRTKAKKLRFYNVKLPIPPTPSSIQKMKGVQWYLCLEKDGVFTIKHQSLIDRTDYLIAEMENNDQFKLDPDQRTRLHFSNIV